MAGKTCSKWKRKWKRISGSALEEEKKEKKEKKEEEVGEFDFQVDFLSMASQVKSRRVTAGHGE